MHELKKILMVHALTKCVAVKDKPVVYNRTFISSLFFILFYLTLSNQALALDFEVPASFQLSNTSPKDVLVTDLDGDGNDDMIFTMSGVRGGDSALDINFGDGLGGLNNVTLPGGIYPPQGVTVADFNQDGVKDIAYSFNAGTRGGVVIYLQGVAAPSLGNRFFTRSQIINLSVASLDGIVSSDFNADGFTDLAVSSGAKGLYLLNGLGDGSFSSAVAVPAARSIPGRDLKFADFNNDNIVDLVTPTSLYIGTGKAGFIRKSGLGGGIAVATGDLNNDGFVDAVSVGSTAIVTHLGKGDGTFRLQPVIFALNTSFQDVVIADVNKDGFNDVIVSKKIANGINVAGNVEVYLGPINPVNGKYSTVLSFPAGVNPVPLAMGDFNSDGLLDYVTGNDDPVQADATYALQIKGTPVANIAPVASPLNLKTIENTPVTFKLPAVDANKDPLTFSYSLPLSGGTLTGIAPDLVYTAPAGFSGTDTFTFTAQDPSLAVSNVATVSITVSVLNTAPVITGQSVIFVNEDTTLFITTSKFKIFDKEDLAFTLRLLPPAANANYTVIGNRLTPAKNFNGILSIPLVVNDGTVDSAVFNAVVKILAVNDVPIITGQKQLATPEDKALTLSLTDLKVTDVDSSVFTMSVLAPATNANYAVKGNTITPKLNYNGALKVSVRVNDGLANSAIFNASVTVTAVNDAPVITGQGLLNRNEDIKITLRVSDFKIRDVDSSAFTLSLLTPAPGSNYTVVGTTITPVLNYNGSLVVPVRVSDGTTNSAIFKASVRINAVNDAPVITGQKPLSTLEGQALAVTVTDLTITDVDTTGGFVLTVLPPAKGANYSVTGNTITPSAIFNGQLAVSVVVNDGSTNSNIFTLAVKVTPVNNVPVITGQNALSSAEDTPFILRTSNFNIVDPDNNTFTLSVLTPTANANYTVQGTTITPKLNYNGPLAVPVSVSDGTNRSVVFNASVTITAVNDVPVANAGVNLTARVGDLITLNGSGSTDVDGDTLFYYWVTTSKPAGSNIKLSNIFVVNPTAIIDIPGVYSFTLFVSDGVLTGNSDAVTVSVTSGNTTPVADNKLISTNEDTTTTIVLSGSDAEQNPLSYAIVNQPVHGTLQGLPPNLTYTPFVNYNGTDNFTYKTNDGVLDSLVANVSIAVKPVNDAPVANAGADKTVFVGDSIILDGSSSTDVDGDQLLYYWIPTKKPVGSTLRLSNNNVVNPTATIDLPGVYSFTLFVYDGLLLGTKGTVLITTVNSAPVANAGLNQSVLIGGNVTLTASGSTDIDGNPLTYKWTLSSIPVASAAVLSDPLAINPTFNADFLGTYVAQLIVNDGAIDSSPITVTISTINSAPIANPGVDQSVFTGDLVTLDGSASLDVDGNALTYRWAVTSKPVGSVAALSSSLIINPTFTVDLPGIYVVQLIVNDGTVDSVPQTVSISTINSAPIANPGLDQSVLIGDLVILDGSASSDADNDSLLYSWSLTTPPGSTASLSDPFVISPTFTADVNGTYIVQLIVNDGIVDSTPVNVLITTSNTNTAPISNPGFDQSVFTGDLVSLSGIASSDADNDPLTYKWSLSAPIGSKASISNQFAVNPTFTADIPGTYVAQLIVNDGTVDSLPVTVSISVTAPINVNFFSLIWKGGDQQLLMTGRSDPAILNLTYTSNGAPIMTINNSKGGQFETLANLPTAPCAITVSTNTSVILLNNIAISGATANNCK